jgi:acetyl-CoA C-acetyltransferase
VTERPVLIGWSQVTRFEGEPLDAWAEALRATKVDPATIESLDVVYCQSWPYDDPPGRLAEAVGASPRRQHYSGIGGTTPLVLLGDAAERIMSGEVDVCAIVGGEALATVRQFKKRGERPQWSYRDPMKRPFPFEAPFHPSEVAHQVFQAYTTFALRDVARRAHLGEPVDVHNLSIGHLFAPMTKVAAENPHAWFPQERSAEELITPTPQNRIVSHPYTKLVTAILDVDQSAALVVASESAADRMGVPSDQRVYLRAWAVDRDPDYVAEHPELWRSPAMKSALSAALRGAGVGADDVAHFDIYSCFASSVSFTLDSLGLAADDPRAPFTVTGGLPYAGGPGSCYCIGSTAAMADVLVKDPGSVGMVTGVGMHLSRHAAMVLSTTPGGAGGAVPCNEAHERLPIVDSVDGPATVAAYTVQHGAEGNATEGLAVCDVPGGRCYARVIDAGMLAEMEEEEFVGRAVNLRSTPEGVNFAGRTTGF